MPTLNWHKREEAVRAATRAPYRLLEPVAELSYGDADSENLLIQGDNLDALKPNLPCLRDLRVHHPAPSI
jgi:adenine-specific DNA-methyltransferase